MLEKVGVASDMREWYFAFFRSLIVFDDKKEGRSDIVSTLAVMKESLQDREGLNIKNYEDCSLKLKI